MKKILYVFLLAISVTKAQTYVTIPDANFVSWLQANFPGAMSGNQLQTTNPAITSATTMLVAGKGIADLTGVQYFTSLQHLDCGANLLSSLPNLPGTIKYLCCNENQLANLPSLPSGLQQLLCDSNLLVSLPSLPSSLLSLKCIYNPLVSLPALPSSLDSLIVGYDSLTSLPTLPTQLKYLECQYNKLTSLPVLPSTVEGLACFRNSLTSIPTLPTSLIWLACSHNLLTSLPALPSSLTQLACDSNNLTSLPALPNSLQYLDCSRNQLTGLPALPASLGQLVCHENQLSTLPTLPNLFFLDCSFNNMSCLPQLPTSINSYSILSGNQINCLPNYIPAMSAQVLSIPLCGNGNTNGCPTAGGILGYVYKDNNGNCGIDTNDQALKNIHLRLYDNNNVLKDQTYSSYNGLFNFAKPNGSYKIVVDTANLPFGVSCVYPGIDTTVAVVGLDSNVNFPLTCEPGFDIGVQGVCTWGWVFPGQQHFVRVSAGSMSNWFGVTCTNGVSGQVQITINGKVSYVSPAAGALTPLVNGNTLTYTIPDFGLVNNDVDFQMILMADTVAQAGDTICISVVVTPGSSDNNTANNTYQFCYLMTNSHDPNLKEVYPVGVPVGYHDWFTYTIHFQNTGSAPAFNIRLADTLDSKLDLATFEVLGSSHINHVYLNGQVLTVYFPNINLPDSTTDPQGSIGSIQYRVKPKTTWTFPSTIKNRANIYFDYNPPILTNTTINSFLTAVGVATTSESIFKMYPNPSSGLITVQNGESMESLRVIDLMGREVVQLYPNKRTALFEIHEPGIYIVSVKVEGRISFQKVVVE